MLEKSFVARVGDSTAKFILGTSPEERVLEFSNPGRLRTIEIDIPSPASPKALGMGDDERALGIGLTELRIARIEGGAGVGNDSVAGSNTIDFRRSAWPGIIKNATGLSSAEQWGTWSLGGAVTLEFSTPLPDRFAVHLVAHAFGPNVGKEFVARVGDSTAKFILGTSPKSAYSNLVIRAG